MKSATLTFGIIGTGSIVKTMLPVMRETEEIDCLAVYSRSAERAAALAAATGIKQTYTNLSQMLADPKLDWIYVASPNSLHYPQVKAALLADKHVLCEKPFTLTAAELSELTRLAKERKLWLVEAITSLFHPHFTLVKEQLSSIGRIRQVLGVFAQYSGRYDALLTGGTPNVFNPVFGGGALMDLNVYNLYFTIGLFGAPQGYRHLPGLHTNGVDTNGVLTLQYPDHIATCIACKDAPGDNSYQLIGEQGYIKISPSASNPARVEICLRGREPLVYETCDSPWRHEIHSFVDLYNFDLP